MKRKIIGAGICAVLAALPFSAYAYDASITMSGSVSTNSCTVTAPSTVTLPTVSTAVFGAVGATAGTTPFSINLSGCTTGVATATALFEQGGNVNPTSGHLLNTGTATGLEIGIYNPDGTPLNLANAAGSQGVPPVSITSGTGTARFIAKYIATSATPGAGTTQSMLYVTFVYA